MQAVKRALLWVVGVFCGLIAFGGVLTLTDPSGYEDLFASELILTIVFAAGAFYCIQSARGKIVHRGKPEKKSKKQQEEEAREYQIKRRMAAEATVELPVEHFPVSVVLKPGEICYYQHVASVVVTKTETVGHTSGSRGISVRVAKGVTLHGGGSRGHAIKQDVTYKFPGFFTITSQRILMTGDKGFDYPLNKLTAFTEYTDGFQIQFGRYNYVLSMDEPFWPNKVISLIQSGASIKEEDPDLFEEATPTQEPAAEQKDIAAGDAFSDEAVETPEGAEISYLDAEALQFWNKKRTDFQIPQYYQDTAFGRNVGPALQRLLDGGFLTLGTPEQRVSLKTVPELKAILADKELKTTGKKAELVHRVLDNFDPDELDDIFPVNVYQITDKGWDALEPYSIIEESKQHLLDLPYYRLMNEKQKHPDEEDKVIIVRMLSEDIQKCYQTQDKFQYGLVMGKMARYLYEVDEPASSFECYALAFFVRSAELSSSGFSGDDEFAHRCALGLDRSGQRCEYGLDEMLSKFTDAVQKNHPFMLNSAENISGAISLLKKILKLK